MKKQVSRWGPLVGAWLAYLVVAMDQVMLPGAASDIVRDLDTEIGAIQIALAMFSVVAASLYLTAGKLGDMRGRRATFATGVVFMIAGAVVVMLAPGASFLFAGWALLRGVGFALILPNVFAVLTACYQGRERDAAFALFATAGPTGAIVGPLLMGWMATELVWRNAFLPDLFLLAGALALAATMPRRATCPGESLDRTGSLLAVAGAGSIILAGTLAGTLGWWRAARPLVLFGRVLYEGAVSVVPLILLAGLVASAFFIERMRRLEGRGDTPLLRTALFRNRAFVTAWLAVLGLFFIFSSIVFNVPVFVQSAFGFDAMETGWIVTIFALAMGSSGLLSGVIRRRLSLRWTLTAAAALTAVGLVLAACVVGGVASVRALTAALATSGLGLGVLIAQAPNAAMSAVEVSQRGEAGGLNAVGEETGVGLGIAVSGSMLIGLGLDAAAMKTTFLVLVAVAMAIGVVVCSLRAPARTGAGNDQ